MGLVREVGLEVAQTNKRKEHSIKGLDASKSLIVASSTLADHSYVLKNMRFYYNQRGQRGRSGEANW